MKKIKTVIVCGLLLVFTFVYAHIDKQVTIYDRDVDSSEYAGTGVLTTGRIEQEFVAREDILDGVRVKCVVAGIPDKTELSYSLKDIEADKTVAKGTISGRDIKTGKFFTSKFEQVTGTRGRRYAFVLEEKHAVPEHGVGFYYEQKTEANTSFRMNGEEKDGTFIMKTISSRFDAETFAVVLCFFAFITVFMKILYKFFK